MKSIRIAGVPEHFNYPWKIAIEQGLFQAAKLDVLWTDVPQGTGRMCEMLRRDETDLAVILTEGIVRDIANGNPSCIVQVYVESPLLWGIHVWAGSPYRSVGDLKNKTVAVSRMGSGSHLMAAVHASFLGWDVSELRFEQVDTIDGAVDALRSGRADYFMWERFMTKPLVDNGTFRRLGDCPTPWPCFVIAVRDQFMEQDASSVQVVLEIINAMTQQIRKPGLSEAIAENYSLNPEDVEDWLQLTRWSVLKPSEEMLNNVQKHLLELSLIHKKATFTQLTCIAARCNDEES